MISAREQLTVTPGEAQEKKTLSQMQLDALGGCLLDFRDLALRAARSNQEPGRAERMLDIDRAAFGRNFEGRDLDSEDLASEGVITVTDTEEFRRDFQADPVSPPTPDPVISNPPIPGEHL